MTPLNIIVCDITILPKDQNKWCNIDIQAYWSPHSNPYPLVIFKKDSIKVF